MQQVDTQSDGSVRTDAERSAADLLEVMLAPFRSYSIYAAAKLGLADLLAAGPVATAELAERTGTDPAALGRLLRMLVSLDVLRVDGDEHRLGPLGEMLRTDRPGSMHDLALCYAERFYQPFLHLENSLRTGGQSFAKAWGKPVFELCAEAPEVGRIFDGAMAAGSTFFEAVPAAWDFGSATTVVDVAGGTGSLLAVILQAYPGLRGTLAEQPRILDNARAALAARGLADRVDVVEGDIFSAVPAGADVYLLSRILHDWDDDTCRVILRTLRAATPAGAALLVVERVLPTDGEHGHAVDFDLHMLVNTGGQERSEDEFDVLFAEAGFRRERTVELPMGVRLLVTTAV